MDALREDDDQEMVNEMAEVYDSVYPDPTVWQANLRPPSPPPAKRRKIQQGRVTNDSSSESDYLPSDRSEDGEEISEEDESHDEGNAAAAAAAAAGNAEHPRTYEGAKRGPKKGPRKPVEPDPQFKLLHNQAIEAFIDLDYDRAASTIRKAIQINPEIFSAHSLLSEIYLAQGDKEKSLGVLFSGAHTRPKDPSAWSTLAKRVVELAAETPQGKASALRSAIYCWGRILHVEPMNHKVRFDRAAAYRELGYNGKAVLDYERLLREFPNNMEVVRLLTDAYIEIKQVPKARSRYEECISHFIELPPEEAIDFTWSDVNIYAELFGYLKEFGQGIAAIKFLSRWMLGRQDDWEWDQIEVDDREFDVDDHPRRAEIAWFVPGRYPVESYGAGLPLELRVKLGSYRLETQDIDEALMHLAFLNPEDDAESRLVLDYADLFKEAADSLMKAGLYHEAIRFYVPLQGVPEYTDTGLFMALAECYDHCENEESAEQCYHTVIDYDENDIKSRYALAKLYYKQGMLEKALNHVNEAIELESEEYHPGRRGGRRVRPSKMEYLSRALGAQPEGKLSRGQAQRKPEELPEDSSMSFTQASRTAQKRRVAGLRRERGRPRGEHIKFLHTKLLDIRPLMREGDENAVEDWLDIAESLIRDFRTNRIFFPAIKRTTFSGYSREDRKKAFATKRMGSLDEMHELASRLQTELGYKEEERAVPQDYHGISFDDWLDVFLEYALLLASQDHPEAAFDSLSVASDANVWYHSREHSRLIYTCWLTCAVRLNDEEALAITTRWFMREYQFVTDTYRLFMTLARVCGDVKKSLFHSSANMKYILRQIKAVDYTLPDDPFNLSQVRRTRASVFQERASLTTKDASGNPIRAGEMDVVLLFLYGHILFTGTSYTNALNYFFRAYALDAENPAVLLSIALSYIHHALKRQSDNRHYLIMQGLSFMYEYKRIRGRSTVIQERQEIEFNFARVWHMLGLAHLAIESYQRCLDLGLELQEQIDKESTSYENAPKHRSHENFTRDAAYALQGLYAISGAAEPAREITNRYLVI